MSVVISESYILLEKRNGSKCRHLYLSVLELDKATSRAIKKLYKKKKKKNQPEEKFEIKFYFES